MEFDVEINASMSPIEVGEVGLMLPGAPGLTPHIGDNGTWWIGATDTGVPATGASPHIGANGNWYVGDTDTGVPATSEDLENARLAAEAARDAAQQALSDLLAMLGTDIATLTNGKLTPSQIPALSINDVYEVASVAEMLTLTAERGDTALIMGVDENDNPIVTDSYILASDDPTVVTNWKKLGISYVANAGHATTAGTAENSDRINGKRMVSMTQSQYDAAALDADTFYVVTPDGV